MTSTRMNDLKAIILFLLITPIIFFGCSSITRDIQDAVGIEPIYESNNSECAERAWQDRHECENEVLLEKNQCLERARAFAGDEYQRELTRYEQKDASCENAYQRALRDWERKYQNYQHCKQRYSDPYDRSKYCGSGHRKPDRRQYCGQNFKPNYDQIIYSQKNNCNKNYNNDKRRCRKRFESTWVSICNGSIK